MKKLNKKQKLIILIAIVTTIVIIGIAVGANVIRTNIANGSYESSNSGSNNGNLLPEYIKKGITLGGVTGTLESLDTSDATATEWDIAYGETAYVNGEKITGLFVPRSSLKIGDYVEYTPDAASAYSLPSSVSGSGSNQTINQDTSLTWQILNINNDGSIDLVSSETTNKDIYLKGALGYNNGVYVLNDLTAKQYSNSSLGVTARSINLEDIENHFTEEGISERNSYKNNRYGQSTTSPNTSPCNYYPKLYEQEKRFWHIW